MATKIDLSSMTQQELLDLNREIIRALRNLDRKAADAFRVGDVVEWDSPRHGRRFVGTVEKINSKTVTVNVPNTSGFRVSGSLLRKSTATPSLPASNLKQFPVPTKLDKMVKGFCDAANASGVLDEEG